MDLGIEGKTALVLGGTQGLALSAARHLADAGVIVVLNGRDANKDSKAASYLGSSTRFVQDDIAQANDRVSIIDQTTAIAGPPAILGTNSCGPPPMIEAGWGWSGDLATVDEDAFSTLIDRSKDLIISGGENIYPKEIEDALCEHGAVGESAVFGIPEEKFGEVPAAYILVKQGRSVTEEEIVEHCATRLARFKRPRLVKFVDDIPKTLIGKIQNNFLKDPYWAEKEKKI